MIKSPLKITKDKLESMKMRLLGIMHIDTNLLHYICYGKIGEGQILKAT